MRPLTLCMTMLAATAAAAGAQAASANAGDLRRPNGHAATVQTVAAARSAAEGEAARLLASLPVPPGSTALGGEPPEAGGALAPAPARAVAVDLVTGTGWWTVPGGPRAAIEYVHDHLPELSPFSRSVFPVAIRPGTLGARIRMIEGAGAVGERWLVLTAVA